MRLEEKIGRKSFAITRDREFWACIVNPVAVTFLSSVTKEQRNERERERKWGGTKSEGGREIESARVVQPTMIWEMSTSSMRNARSIWLFLTTSTRGTWSPLSSFSFVDIAVYRSILPSPSISLLSFQEIKEIPLWRSSRSRTSLREMGCVSRNGISREKRGRFG